MQILKLSGSVTYRKGDFLYRLEDIHFLDECAVSGIDNLYRTLISQCSFCFSPRRVTMSNELVANVEEVRKAIFGDRLVSSYDVINFVEDHVIISARFEHEISLFLELYCQMFFEEKSKDSKWVESKIIPLGKILVYGVKPWTDGVAGLTQKDSLPQNDFTVDLPLLKQVMKFEFSGHLNGATTYRVCVKAEGGSDDTLHQIGSKLLFNTSLAKHEGRRNCCSNEFRDIKIERRVSLILPSQEEDRNMYQIDDFLNKEIMMFAKALFCMFGYVDPPSFTSEAPKEDGSFQYEYVPAKKETKTIHPILRINAFSGGERRLEVDIVLSVDTNTGLTNRQYRSAALDQQLALEGVYEFLVGTERLRRKYHHFC